MSREQFYCAPCNAAWHDNGTFWTAYRSPCPHCGQPCEAVIDAWAPFTDPRMMDGPLFDFAERSEEDLEAERGTIRDEIAEAIGAVAEAEEDAAGESESDGAEADE